MGYVAVKGRTILGDRYKAGQTVDVSEWPARLVERMEDARRIAWVQSKGDEERPTARSTVPSDLAAHIERANEDATAAVGHDAAADAEEAEPDDDTRVQVYHRNGGYYYRIDNNTRVEPKGADDVRAAGYEIVEFAEP